MQCAQKTKKGTRCKNTSKNGVCHIHSVKFNIKSFPSPSKKLKKRKSPKNVLKEKRELRMMRDIDRQMERIYINRDEQANQQPRRFVPFFDNRVNAENPDLDFEL